jgi:predicted nuclease with RNAse H fold
LRTLGIDLAAQDRNTAACAIEWAEGGPRVETPTVGHDDDSLLAAIRASELTGIDAPFGWPQLFAEAVAAHQARERWPGSAADVRKLGADGKEYRRRLSYRLTDLTIMEETGARPLSVSTDRIGVTTFRCALLLDRLQHEGQKLKVDRSGMAGRVAEVYPAAALAAWGLDNKGYKGSKGAGKRAELVERLSAELGPGFADEVQAKCRQTDHALDALISALVARAVAQGQTRRPVGAELGQAASMEGWIHIPAEEIRALW